MHKLSIEQIISRIEKGLTFSAVAKDNSFSIKINSYVPYVCTAIHDGHHFRDELSIKTVLSEYERWYEEDPFTGDFIASMPITLVGHDSRFEYDLNRDPSNAVYDTAWGKRVWRKPLTKDEKKRSLTKHTNYYRVVSALVKKLEQLFNACVVYDMHSYNWRRWDRSVPVFNIGSEKVDQKRFGDHVNSWAEELRKIELPNDENTTEINDVFKGYGYQLAHITQNFKNTLVLATEVSKIYCNEETGEPFPAVVGAISDQMKTAIVNHAHSFAEEFTSWHHDKKHKLLANNLEDIVLEIDQKLFKLVKDFELLNYVNPTNTIKEKKKFFSSKGTENPDFTYRPIRFDAYSLKRELFDLEVEKITDIHIQNLYKETIQAYVDKIDLLDSINTDKFVINSLKYFGKPSLADIANARLLLSLNNPDPISEKSLTTEDAMRMFSESFDSYGFKGKIEVSSNITADAMVMNQQKKVLVKKGARFAPKGLEYLVHHEIGVHMVTTMNSNEQPLKIFNIGLPVNTKTQEGLAVLAEFLSGNIMMSRLRELALRVLAVDMMVNGADFKKTFRFLVNEHKLGVDSAFYLTTRIFRGGGFTKDYLYLSGLKEVYKFWKDGNDLAPLLIGKTSFDFYGTIVELMDRGILKHPKHITSVFEKPQHAKNNPIYNFVLDSIK
ncbi:MAG: flavohemoglobin expression-modulating QEGLA motif protein [Flavobacteriales bacterium]